MFQIATMTALIAYLVTLLLFLALHRMDPRNSILRDAVSDYVNGPAARLFRLYGSAAIIGGAALAFATTVTPGHDFPGRVPVYFLGMAALRIGVLAFPTDPGGTSRSTRGRLHLAFAIASFTLTYMAVAATGAHLPSAFTAPLVAALHLLGWIATSALAILVVSFLPALNRVFGLAERGFLLATALWFLIFAIGLQGLALPASSL